VETRGEIRERGEEEEEEEEAFLGTRVEVPEAAPSVPCSSVLPGLLGRCL